MKQKLKRGAILTSILRQDKDTPVCQEMQVIIFYAFNKKYMNDLSIEQVDIFQAEGFAFAQKHTPDLVKLLREKKKLDPEIEKMLDEVITGLITEIRKRAPAATSED
jgi:F0F1-type ATP synthase alpha subunit